MQIHKPDLRCPAGSGGFSVCVFHLFDYENYTCQRVYVKGTYSICMDVQHRAGLHMFTCVVVNLVHPCGEAWL